MEQAQTRRETVNPNSSRVPVPGSLLQRRLANRPLLTPHGHPTTAGSPTVQTSITSQGRPTISGIVEKPGDAAKLTGDALLALLNRDRTATNTLTDGQHKQIEKAASMMMSEQLLEDVGKTLAIEMQKFSPPVPKEGAVVSL
jgi:hypothetical protein